MSGEVPDGRSPMAVAMQWVSQITSIGLEMALPPGIAVWFKAPTWVVILAAVLGFAVAMWHLMQMVAASDRRQGGDGADHE